MRNLAFDHQATKALRQLPQTLAPDALLRAVYDSARNIAYASDVTWYRVERLAGVVLRYHGFI